MPSNGGSGYRCRPIIVHDRSKGSALSSSAPARSRSRSAACSVRWAFTPRACGAGRDATRPFRQSVTIDLLDAQLPGCDWLVLACPLDDSTRGLIDARRLALLPATARLANVARGELVDEGALIDSLQHRRLAGAFLDVFFTEPLPADSPLWTLPGVWLTPHNCAASLGHEDRVVESFLSRLGPWLRDSRSPRPAPSEITEANNHSP